MKNKVKSLAVLLSLTVLFACGGGGESDGPRIAVIGDPEQPAMADYLRQQGFTVDAFSGNLSVSDVVMGDDLVVWVDRSERAAGDIHAYRISTAQQFVVSEQSVRPDNIAVSGNLITWHDDRHGDVELNDIYAFIVDAGGAAGTEVRISTSSDRYRDSVLTGNRLLWQVGLNDLFTCTVTNAGCEQAPQLLPAVDGSKSFLDAEGDWLVWQNTVTEVNDTFFDIYAYNLASQLVFQVNQSRVGYRSRPRVSGNVMVWSDERNGVNNGDIYAYRVTDFMTGEGTEFVVTNSAENELSPEVDGLWVVWEINRNGGDWDIGVARLATRGTDVTTTDLVVASGIQTVPILKENVVLWRDRNTGQFGVSHLYTSSLLISQTGIQTIETFITETGEGNYAINGNQIAWVQDMSLGSDVLYSSDFAQTTSKLSRDKVSPLELDQAAYDALVFGDSLAGISDDDLLTLYDVVDQAGVPMLVIGQNTFYSLPARLAGADRLGLQIDNGIASGDMLIAVEADASGHALFDGLDVNNDINLAYDDFKNNVDGMELMFDDMHPDAPLDIRVLARYSPVMDFSGISNNAPALVEMTSPNGTPMIFDVATGDDFRAARWQLLYNEVDYLTH